MLSHPSPGHLLLRFFFFTFPQFQSKGCRFQKLCSLRSRFLCPAPARDESPDPREERKRDSFQSTKDHVRREGRFQECCYCSMRALLQTPGMKGWKIRKPNTARAHAQRSPPLSLAQRPLVASASPAAGRGRP